MCSISQDNKYTCIYPPPGSSSPSSAHKIGRIFVSYFIIHVYATHETLVASISAINMGVLLLTICTRHFPLSHEGVQKLVIEAVRHAQEMCYRALQFILG